MRKKIGIVGHVISGTTAFGIGVAYVNYFSQFGDVEIISHTETEVRKHLDLIVIPGGPDVEPSRYMNESDILSLSVGKPCLIRERFDNVLLPKYIEAKTPIFGICRGHQTLAVHFGAQLVQDMSHESNASAMRNIEVHDVSVDANLAHFTLKYPVEFPKNHRKGEDAYFTMGVNSIHHQVVKDCPANAVVMARYAGKKVGNNRSYKSERFIEALYYPELNIASVQWHPEEIHDDFSTHVIKQLLNVKSTEKDAN